MKDSRCNQVIIFRTHLYDNYWHKLLLKINDYYTVIVVADNSNNDFSYSGLLQIPFSESSFIEAGLEWEENLQWKCGDYAYYLAYQKLEFDFAWMIESDVFINFENPLSFFDSFKNVRADFISTYLGSADENWFWYRRLDMDSKKYRCFMPLTRMSGRAVNFLKNNRKIIGNSGNDEIFVATCICNSHLEVLDIKDILPGVYSKDTFSFDLPHYSNFIRKNTENIYHPCFFSFRGYVRHLVKKRSYKNVLKSFYKKRDSIG